jgi:hypothetical protein
MEKPLLKFSIFEIKIFFYIYKLIFKSTFFYVNIYIILSLKIKLKNYKILNKIIIKKY